MAAGRRSGDQEARRGADPRARRRLGRAAPGRAASAEADYRGERFADHPRDVANDPDLLNLTRPELVRDVHDAYFAAGADIATTNTFTATSIGQADYGLEDAVYEMNVAGARIAREAAGDRFVAGSVGPLNVTLSLSPRVDDPGFRTHTFDQVKEAYAEQMPRPRRRRRRPAADRDDLRHAEREGGDRRRARDRARAAALDLRRRSSTSPGRTLSGQTIEAFWTSIEHAEPLIVGVNCSLGAQEMRPYVADLVARRAVPRRRATRTPACRTRSAATTRRRRSRATLLREFAAGRLPERRRRLLRLDARAHGGDRRRGARARAAPRPAGAARCTRFSGLEPFEIGAGHGLRPDRRADERHRLGALPPPGRGAATSARAVEVALEQVRGGANLLDVNMDADLLEGEEAMRTFLNVIATEPEVARLPIMVDSSRWTRARGRACSASRARGSSTRSASRRARRTFLAQARRIRDYGAGVVVMAFDEEGQATDVERRVAICGRAYDLLVERGRLPARGHHLRPERARRRDRDRGARRLRARVHRERCRGSRSAAPARARRGGISNLSFSFRGNDVVREAMHARSSTTRSAPGSTWASSTPASSRSTRTSSPSCSSASRT